MGTAAIWKQMTIEKGPRVGDQESGTQDMSAHRQHGIKMSGYLPDISEFMIPDSRMIFFPVMCSPRPLRLSLD